MVQVQEDPLLQLEQRRYAFDRRGTEEWTTLWRSAEVATGRSAEYSALVRPDSVEAALSRDDWDIFTGRSGGGPTLTSPTPEAAESSSYRRFEDDGFEPIVWIFDGHAPLPPALPRLSEEFHLLFGLWANETELRFLEEDGSSTEVAKIALDHVEVRTSFLMRYLAARQMHLAMYIDCTVYSLESSHDDGLIEQVRDEAVVYSLGAFSGLGSRGPGSRLLGKRILPPGQIERSGIWPHELEDTNFPEFVVDVDNFGTRITKSCDPKSPNGDDLTPVFFSRDVLEYYYERPDRFEVERGYLRCGSRWGLDISNGGLGHVSASLCDLGSRLPASERLRWKSYEIEPFDLRVQTPTGGWTRDPDESAGEIEFDFKTSYRRLSAEWLKHFGWSLFRPLHGDDEHRFSRLRVPVNESQPELEAQIGHIAMIMPEALNGKQLARCLDVKNRNGSISQLEAFLKANRYADVDRDISFLRRLQTMRSKVAGTHRKGSDYQKLLEDLDVEPPTRELVKLFGSAKVLLDGLEGALPILKDTFPEVKTIDSSVSDRPK